MCLYLFLLYVREIWAHINIFKCPNVSFNIVAPAVSSILRARILTLDFLQFYLIKLIFLWTKYICKNFLYMVRNHQDRYPFLNLHFFCCWKYTETIIFLVKFIGQWIPNGDGRGIARDIKKIKTGQKMVTKLGQFTKLGPFSTFQL